MDRKTMLLGMIRRLVQPGEVCLGKGSVARLSALECQRAMVIAAASAERSGALATVQSNLQKAGAQVAVCCRPSAEPTPAAIDELAAAAAAHRPDWIVALGGGAILDTAKLAWVRYELPQFDLTAEKPGAIGPLRAKARLAAIPTTAGSGSEASQVAVLSHPTEGRKIPLVSPHLVPDLAILDPALTTSMPGQITLNSGMDAMAHAAEAYTSRLSTPLVKTLSAAAMRIILEYLPRAIEEPENLDVRQQMLDAAYLAGVCQSAASTGLAHALGHAAGAVLGLGHGAAVGCFLGQSMKLSAGKCGPLYDQLAREAGFADAVALLEQLDRWQARLGVPRGLAALAGKPPSPEEIDRITAEACRDMCLRTNACPVEPAEIKQVLEHAPTVSL